ncbi:MAG: hypothetical protein M3238_05230 [Actinomycetota bacterium]|nr:hypothetical protein [Actinomycetota bacterium]
MSESERPQEESEPRPGHDADVDIEPGDDAPGTGPEPDDEGPRPGHDADVGPGAHADRLEHARREIERAEAANDEERLEILEELRRTLEEELDTSVENGASRH